MPTTTTTTTTTMADKRRAAEARDLSASLATLRLQARAAEELNGRKARFVADAERRLSASHRRRQRDLLALDAEIGRAEDETLAFRETQAALEAEAWEAARAAEAEAEEAARAYDALVAPALRQLEIARDERAAVGLECERLAAEANKWAKERRVHERREAPRAAAARVCQRAWRHRLAEATAAAQAAAAAAEMAAAKAAADAAAEKKKKQEEAKKSKKKPPQQQQKQLMKKKKK